MIDFDYQVKRDVYVTGLSQDKVSRARIALDSSERFTVDENNQVLLRQSGMPVGFLGSDSFGFCFPENLNPIGERDLRRAHKFLMSAYSVLL